MLNSINLCTLICATSLIISHNTYCSDKDWKSEWEVKTGFRVIEDSYGFNLPTAIAFVKEPSNNPKDPLYFVTELRGTIKVVTNDRSVVIFAQNFFELVPNAELPAMAGEVGMAGIALDQDHGYVFVSFAYQDKNGLLRNNVVRFTSSPKTFSLKPSTSISFAKVFESYQTSVSHQIGPMVVMNNQLYVAVGDGEVTNNSQSLTSVNGKILRMTLDGHPIETNPFYEDDNTRKARNYIWAYGLRNPFSLTSANSRLFCADNGPGVDRFLEVKKGYNYGYDGTDWSIGMNAKIVFSPSVSPVQMDYLAATDSLEGFPSDKFFLALSGAPRASPGPGKRKEKSIVMLDYNFETGVMNSTPELFIRFIGKGSQLLVGTALGPDGLYMVPMFPFKDGLKYTSVFKVVFDPSYNKSPLFKMTAATIISDKGCFSCHPNSNFNTENTVAPSLVKGNLRTRLWKRIKSKEYRDQLMKIELIDDSPYKDYKEIRNKIVNAPEDEALRLWVKSKLMEPRFDNQFAQMPNMNLSEQEILLLVEELISDEPKLQSIQRTIKHFLKSFLPKELEPEDVYIALVIGLIIGIFSTGIIAVGIRKIRKYQAN